LGRKFQSLHLKGLLYTSEPEKKKGTSKLQRIISEERHLHFDPRSNKKVDTTLRMKASDYYNEHQENSNY
jgi:hypothetical protein